MWNWLMKIVDKIKMKLIKSENKNMWKDKDDGRFRKREKTVLAQCEFDNLGK